jgi:hypothetical protein
MSGKRGGGGWSDGHEWEERGWHDVDECEERRRRVG